MGCWDCWLKYQVKPRLKHHCVCVNRRHHQVKFETSCWLGRLSKQAMNFFSPRKKFELWLPIPILTSRFWHVTGGLFPCCTIQKESLILFTNKLLSTKIKKIKSTVQCLHKVFTIKFSRKNLFQKMVNNSHNKLYRTNNKCFQWKFQNK